MEWVLERLHEKTTWLGILNAIAAIFAIQYPEGLVDAIANLGVAVISVILIVMREKAKSS